MDGTIDPANEIDEAGPAHGQAPQPIRSERRQQELTHMVCRRSEERADGARSIEATGGGVELHARSLGGVGTRAQWAGLVLKLPNEWEIIDLHNS